MTKLYYTTVTPLLLKTLKVLMSAKEFAEFRLVGGTALSLYTGHRESVDIDLFTDAKYDSIDYPYNHSRNLIKDNFTRFETADDDFNPVCLKGKHWEIIKLDLIDFVN